MAFIAGWKNKKTLILNSAGVKEKQLVFCYSFNMRVFSCKRSSFFSLFFLLALALSAQEKGSRLALLLSGYLENDLDLQKYVLSAENARLSYDSTKIENGVSFSLTTGTVKIQLSDDGNKYTFTPGATLELPALNDTSATLSLPMTTKSGFDENSGNENGTFLDNGSFKIETGIVTSSATKRKITLEESKRTYIEALRSAKNQALSAEKEFYEKLNKLYGYASDVVDKKNDKYDDEIDLRVLEAQGYSKQSSAYRTKELEVQSDARDVGDAIRLLERETAIFAVKCGEDYERVFGGGDFEREKQVDAGDEAYKSAMEFLPDSIPSVELEDVLSYKSDDYTETESAKWNQYINNLKRSTDYKLELNAYGEYVFNDSSSGYDTVGGGLTFDWKGVSASAGVAFPTGSNVLSFDSSNSGTKSKSPVYTFGVTLTPNTWRLSSIDKKQDELNSKIDEIAVKSAADNYETDILDKLTSRGDLKWSEKSYAEEYDMYSKLASDSEKWLSQGIITEADYLDAVNNKEKARLNILTNLAEQVIYNDDVKLLFVRAIKN